MGKKRIAIVGNQPIKKERKIVKTGLPDEATRRVVKSGKEHGRITDMAAEALAEAEVIKEKEEKLEKEIIAKATKKAKPQPKPGKVRGKRYLEAKKLIDKTKTYPLSEAIKLLKSISVSRFNGRVDVHLNVKEIGLKGALDFPYPTGKSQIVRITDDQLIKELEQGKINFNILITSPEMMGKLTKFAKLLGPRGLMPNPKAGTITDNPDELVKKISKKVQFRTESKASLIHLSIGKVDTSENHLEENFKALIKVVGKKNIKKAVLAPTMGPGIKVDLSSF